MSNGNTSSFKERRAAEKEISEGIVVQCSNSQEGREIYTSKVIDVPVIEVECVVRGEESCSIRDADEEKSGSCMELESTPQRSAASDSNCPAVIPGSIVWAKTASKMRWPAEALRRKQHGCHRMLSPDRSIQSDWQDHSSDKRTSHTSSRRRYAFPERGRGKREKKRKVHFDEVSFPLKSEKKCRRLKIMRYLGLIAPVGSPF